ncbi:proteasome assembly chaperone 2 [Diachasma alloeum]|uniref:proteasome assembly chaperone 2 n=1 Tax=Diachasma alloeum TaxID=454923 RepID=UPI000738459C|nr:proteasome assembly chaperone 2 [Diachasma alloeum]
MIKLTNTGNFHDCTLIIPAVAVGNVAQLTIDLIISNGELEKIGHITSCCFIPIVGGNPYNANSTQLCTSCDIYHNSERKLIAIQIRSPVTKKPSALFNSVKQFIEDQQINKVIILTSGWAHTRNDAQIQSEPMRYMATSGFLSKFSQMIADSEWTALEKTSNTCGVGGDVKIPGGGFALELFQFLNHYEIPTAILLRFCSEGDNIPDAIALMNYTCKWISLNISEIKVPNSWKFLYGNPAPISLY